MFTLVDMIDYKIPFCIPCLSYILLTLAIGFRNWCVLEFWQHMDPHSNEGLRLRLLAVVMELVTRFANWCFLDLSPFLEGQIIVVVLDLLCCFLCTCLWFEHHLKTKKHP